MKTFQEIVSSLSAYWASKGCNILQGYDLEVGAGTFNPATFVKALGPKPFKAAYMEPSRRPTDGRYGQNPNRLQHFFQYQVVLKPSPTDIQKLYLDSLIAIGFNLDKHDIRFVHDDWESPTLGAWGLGWEVWIDGMEITQFTYFQSVGGVPVKPVMGEITYGLERLAMYMQNVDNVYDLKWNNELSYGDIYLQNEIEMSRYNFEEASVSMWLNHFNDYEKEAAQLIEKGLVLPAVDFILKASHAFNILDARSAISVSERTRYIARIRNLSKDLALKYTENDPPIIPSTTLPYYSNLSSASKAADPAKKEDFVLEVGSEELPHSFIDIGCFYLENSLKKLLEAHDLNYDSIQVYGSPRRITAYITKLASGSEPKTLEKKGPPLKAAFDESGKLTPAGQGFLKSINYSLKDLQSLKDDSVLYVQSLKGIEYLFAHINQPSQSTLHILAEELPKLILDVDFPKKMRWADFDFSYARPLHWIVALYGSKIVDFTLGPIRSSNFSYGHPQLCDKVFKIKEAKDYIEALRKHKVIVDPAIRKALIEKGLREFEKRTKTKVLEEKRVMEEVVNLTEWPTPILAEFDPLYLKAPKELLISEMIQHQRYFPLVEIQGTLSPYFIIVSDNRPSDQIRLGNVKAITPRLADGLFLYEEDLKIPLAQFGEKLKLMTFQANTGSLYDKQNRIRDLAIKLSKYIPYSNSENIKLAANLCKCDLASSVVFEFPELQGIIGKDYALSQGINPEVACAIEEHWRPTGEDEPLPESNLGILIGFADKLDNLVTCFANDQKPSASSDPFALRRQVLGIIRTLIAHEIRLPIIEVLQETIESFKTHFPEKKITSDMALEITTFIEGRIKTVFTLYGFAKDEIQASLSTGFSDIYDMYERIKALKNFRSTSEFSLLWEVFKRAKGQLSHATSDEFNSSLLQETAEKHLYEKLAHVSSNLTQTLKNKQYTQAYTELSSLQPHLATFFDEVKVLADDPKLKQNRLALLKQVLSLFEQLLDFTEIVT